MPSERDIMTAQEWMTEKRDDSPHILQAMREWNFRQPAWTKVLQFSDIPAGEQSRVLMRAAKLAQGEK